MIRPCHHLDSAIARVFEIGISQIKIFLSEIVSLTEALSLPMANYIKPDKANVAHHYTKFIRYSIFNIGSIVQRNPWNR